MPEPSALALALHRVAEHPVALTTILEEIAEPLIAFDHQRVILSANEAAEGLLRLRPG